MFVAAPVVFVVVVEVVVLFAWPRQQHVVTEYDFEHYQRDGDAKDDTCPTWQQA